MTRWEPLPDTMGANARRLAVQLRRMKDRSGLALPAIAARTSLSTEVWERFLNGVKVPPLDAVEALGQLCGADYDRLDALWELAERGGGSRVPDPDPLDPLAPYEGLPRGRRRRGRLLVAAFGLVPAVALGVLVLAGLTSEGAGSGPSGLSATSRPQASGRSGPQAPGGFPVNTAPGGPGGAATTGPATLSGADDASAGAAGSRSGAPSDGTDGTDGTEGGTGTPGATPAASGSGSGSGWGAATEAPAASASASPSAPAPAAAPTQSALCLGVIILDLCVGG